jgi:hypothetical protein
MVDIHSCLSIIEMTISEWLDEKEAEGVEFPFLLLMRFFLGNFHTSFVSYRE